jgi:hypothetical protein
MKISTNKYIVQRAITEGNFRVWSGKWRKPRKGIRKGLLVERHNVGGVGIWYVPALNTTIALNQKAYRNLKLKK